MKSAPPTAAGTRAAAGDSASPAGALALLDAPATPKRRGADRDGEDNAAMLDVASVLPLLYSVKEQTGPVSVDLVEFVLRRRSTTQQPPSSPPPLPLPLPPPPQKHQGGGGGSGDAAAGQDATSGHADVGAAARTG
ncbi:unnamed protein product, partial [Phaeothamnion confervicola]